MHTLRAVVARLAVLVSLLLAAGLAAGSSAARSNARPGGGERPLALRLHWRLIAKDVACFSANERYIAIQPISCTGLQSNRKAAPAVVDLRTGRRTKATPPGCSNSLSSSLFAAIAQFGGPYLVVTCGGGLRPQVHLLNLARGIWSTVAPPSVFCSYGCDVAAVGAHWIEFGAAGVGGDGNPCSEHCGYQIVEQNLQTGKLQADPVKANGRFYANLDAPSGIGELCSPLRVLRNSDADGTADPHWLNLLGSFALLRDDYLGTHGEQLSYLLERCHSRLRLPLANDVPLAVWTPEVQASNDAVVWTKSARSLSGILLPSLRHFTVHPPAPMTPPSVAVIGLMLVVKTGAGQVWESKLPTIRP